jgi:hypothetical protein
MFPHDFLNHLNPAQWLLPTVILFLSNQRYQMLERLRKDFLNFLVVLCHDDFAVVVDQLDYLVDRKCNAVAFELLEDLVYFLPVKSALDVCLAVQAEQEVVDALEAADDQGGFD